jgi:DNA-binding NarL/FixJ family response regulator
MRVLLADDHAWIRSALRLLLTEEPGVIIVGEASEATGLLAQMHKTHPDLVLLDWELPGLATIGSVPALHTACANLSVIVLSGRPEARQEALAAGADDFFSKVDPPEQLLTAIHAIDSKNSGTDHLTAQSTVG